jgi:hypothetical protein
LTAVRPGFAAGSMTMTMSPLTTRSQRKAVRVWDRTTRWFHAINLMCVLALMILALANLASSSKEFVVPAAYDDMQTFPKLLLPYPTICTMYCRLQSRFMGWALS